MSSGSSSLSLGDELNCPMCLDIFIDPVMLECGHDFCRQCILQCWEKEKKAFCPECGEVFREKNLKANRALGVLSNKIRSLNIKQNVEPNKVFNPFCDEHQEELKLFCETDKKLICVMCLDRRDGRSHKSHNFMLINEAVEIYKDKMRGNLQALNQKKTSIQNVLLKQQQSISEIQEQSNILQKHISSEFTKLRTVLEEKERALAKELGEQEEDILKKMESNLRDIQEHLNETEEKLSGVHSQLNQQDAFSLLKEDPDKGKSEANYLTTVTEGRLPLGSFKGPIQYKVWRDIMDVINPAPAALTMDPSTAHPLLVLSEDRTSVKFGEKSRSAPDATEPSERELSVLGSVGFTSGRHYWEVIVGSKTSWEVGVVKDTFRKRGSRAAQDGGCWILGMKNGNEYWASTANPTRVVLNAKPKKVGVYLDYEGGQLSFYNANNMSTLFTFIDSFSGKMYPYFSPGSNEDRKNTDPLIIMQLKTL
ncbi:zinc-binding protein A33-like [Scyliorhinus canicula]|uniref:zinc-binding protein A33-like n=1 Tax=Scyliorhinus canicula TaxID=7830 RepID=UPI0018F33BF3|nr:zinc-binding protein A33-like [Scyliorhinus canicula]XP_038673348.1 zinc-binding protein A33-like [Scyliorhinus canicula]XP_038673349.1 zinc-binding protein A33-like [Scyliorhinus canicula]